jgi:hypothetical protein
MLLGGHGLGVQNVVRGDINCDCVPYSVADAMMFVGYLVYGNEALQDGAGDYYCGSFEAHCFAADIDGDGFCFTVNDLILLIRIINGYEMPPPKVAPTDLVVTVAGEAVSVDKEVGAARFVFDGEGEVSGTDVVYTHRDGQTIVLAYTLEDRALSGHLFTISGDVELESVEASDFYGSPMVAKTVEVPVSFALMQNYPNPFNPATEIRYNLPSESHVKIEVYNALGQRVATLVDTDQPAGYHAAAWDGSAATSGVYFYRIEAGQYSATRKMVLLK